MTLAVFLSILAGAFGVLQAGLNKVIADSIGFTSSLFLNSCFFFLFNCLFFALVWLQPKWFPGDFAIGWSLRGIQWWWLLPGLMGFSLVLGLAVAVGRIGATQTFVICIAVQIITSLGWDLISESQELNTLRIIGAAVTLIGAVLATIS